MKRCIFPDELNYKSVSCGFECNNFNELMAIAKYLNSIGCPYSFNGLYILPDAELIPLKHSSTKEDVYEYIMIQF